ncbi:MAG: hypothetical protein FIA95_03880 [Gemmatimonadetes bacterium]|nr:hypothetical protein [Gemmatimonadota bacterium]
MTHASARRVLLVLGLLALLSLAVFDLVRLDSLLRRAWTGLHPASATPAQEIIQEIQRTRGQSLR